MRPTVAAVLLSLITSPPVPAQVRSPTEVLGIPIGADSVLADWAQITRYMNNLGNASPYVRTDTIGRSTLGKPLVLLTITAPRHQRRLAEIRRGQALLADPRRLTPAIQDSLLADAPAVVFINNNIHSTEIASSQFSMILAHRLATDPTYQAWLEDLVVLMTPSANPDGQDTVVAWYRAHQGTPYEDGPLPWLYHPYVGHDNNRDWFMISQVETEAITRVLYHEWFPQVVWDVHQMGNDGARMFLPPFADPVNPNLDPALVEAISLAGTAMASAIYDAGKTGVEHRRSFDLWWHGGFRTVPARHNMIGILSEVASVGLASPVYQTAEDLDDAQRRGVNYPGPWEPGWWRLGDIIEYELLAAEGLLRLVSSQRETFLRRFVTLGHRQIEFGRAGHPFAYLIPPDQDDAHTAQLLANTVLKGGVEIRRATRSFQADATAYPPGTLVIPMAQPFRAHAKDLLERQDYPNLLEYPGGPPDAPYDVAGWTLGLMMGVDVREVAGPFRYEGVAVDEAPLRRGVIHGEGNQVVLRNHAAMESRTIAAALAAGGRAVVLAQSVTVAGTRLPAGSVLLESEGSEDLANLVAEHAARYGFDAWRTHGLRPGTESRAVTRPPRIGLYKPWTASMDEGWTRWVFEQYGIPFVTVTDSVIRAGNLGNGLDVLVFPDLSERSIVSGYSQQTIPRQYAGGIGEIGAGNVVDFVRMGGVLVTLDGSSDFAVSRLNLPVRNGLADAGSQDSGSRFYVPGSILGVALQPGSPVTSGLGDSAAIYFARSRVFEAEAPARVLARYGSDPLLSGYALSREVLDGKAALVDAPAGDGRVILFGFRPQHRGQTHGTFKMLFNAVLLGGAR